MRRHPLFRLALFATACLWQTGLTWAQAPAQPAPPGQAAGPRARTRSVTGTVLEEGTGAGVSGATVKVKGGEATAVTGGDGSFTIEVPRAEATLELSGPQHVTKEIVVGARQRTVQTSLSRSAPTQRTVTGLVKEAGSGKPIAGAVVAVKGTSTTTSSDSDGLFVLTGVPTGPVELEVSSQEHQASALNVPEGQSTAKLELTPTAGVPPPAAEAPAQATTRTVRGRVAEADTGEAVPGATVQVVGTETVAITDEKGEFELTDVPLSDVLIEVQSTGYETIRLSAAAGVANVSAAVKFAASEEIIIVGRAPVLMKSNLAHGASVVNDRDLNRVSAGTLDTAMTGKVSGANFQSNSGAPGGGTQLRLRGVSTIIGQSSPLYVIDGVILSNAAIPSNANAITRASGGGSASNQDNPINRIADINPSDIENIEILKGASAAALYGSKAANGVVIITTKRARIGEARTSVNVTQRIGIAQVSNRLGSRRFNSLEEVMDTYDNPALIAAYTGETFDHEKAITQTPIIYETIASASGGSKNGSYSASILVRDEPGVVKNTFAQKQSGRLNIGYSFGDKLQLALSNNLIHSKSDRGLTNNDNTGTSLYVALSGTPSFVNLRRNPDGTYPVNPIPAISNPLQTVDLLDNEEDVWRLISSAAATSKLWSNQENAISLQANLGVDRYQQLNNLYSPPSLEYEPDDGQPGTAIAGTTQNLNFNLGVGGVWTLTPKNNLFRSAFSTGFTYEYVDVESVFVTSRNLTGAGRQVDAGTSRDVDENHLRTKDQGFYAQEEVALLDDRLTLLGGVLFERSSLAGNTDKFYLFPKGAVSYKLPIAEKLFNPIRVRAAYGEAGNRPNYGQKFTPLNTSATVDSVGGLVIANELGLPTAGDPNIEPERQREFELGFDAAMEDQRVVVELTGYQRNISNLLLQRSVATSTGFQTEFLNGGAMRNRGIEAALQVLPMTILGVQEATGLDWTARATLTLNRSRITDLPSNIEAFNIANVGFGAGLGAYRIEEGKSATQIVSDVDGDGIPDRVGDGEPDFRIGVSNEFKFGDFGLFSLIDWQHGSEIINLTRFLYDGSAVSEDFLENGMGRLETFAAGDIRPYIESASFVKLREVSLYYDVPQGLASQLGPLNSLRISLQGRNLLTFTGYSGLDPEVSNFGNQPIGRNYDVAPYPPSRSYWLSVDAGF